MLVHLDISGDDLHTRVAGFDLRAQFAGKSELVLDIRKVYEYDTISIVFGVAREKIPGVITAVRIGREVRSEWVLQPGAVSPCMYIHFLQPRYWHCRVQ